MRSRKAIYRVVVRGYVWSELYLDYLSGSKDILETRDVKRARRLFDSVQLGALDAKAGYKALEVWLLRYQTTIDNRTL